MSVAFDTGQIPKADRAEAVRAAVAEHLVPVEIDFAADRGPAAARIAITDLAELTVWTSISNAVKVHRTAALTHDDFTPSIFMGLRRSRNRNSGPARRLEFRNGRCTYRVVEQVGLNIVQSMDGTPPKGDR